MNIRKKFLREMGEFIKMTFLLYFLYGLFSIVVIIIILAIIIYIKETVIDGRKAVSQLADLNKIQFIQLINYEIINPYQGTGSYCRAQLHTHTTNSDGKLSPDQLISEYERLGFKYLAITDHDKVTKVDSEKSEIVLINGEEMTYPRPFRPLGYHINRLFIDQAANRSLKKKHSLSCLQDIIDHTEDSGGIIVINHPSFIGNLGSQQWLPEKLLGINNFFLIEIANHHTDNEFNILYWHALLNKYGYSNPIWAIGGDDTHRREDIATNYIMIRVDMFDKQSLHRSLKSGDFYITQGPEVEFDVCFKKIIVRILNFFDKEMNKKISINQKRNEDGEVCIIFKDSANIIRKKVKNSFYSEYQPEGNEGFIRIEVIDVKSNKKAWSQPFWLKEN